VASPTKRITIPNNTKRITSEGFGSALISLMYDGLMSYAFYQANFNLLSAYNEAAYNLV
jgi:hypothetical protein